MSFHHIILILALSGIVLAEETPPPDHLVAAYPLSIPVEDLGELTPLKNTPPETRFILRNDTLQEFQNFDRFPFLKPSEHSWIIYNSTTNTLIAKASPRFHLALRREIPYHPSPINLRAEFRLYQMSPDDARAFVTSGNAQPSGAAKELVTLCGTSRAGFPMELISQEDLPTESPRIRWESDHTISNNGWTIFLRTILDIESHDKAHHLELEFESFSLDLKPTIVSLGAITDIPGQNYVAVITATPIAPNGDPMMAGRVCEKLSDHRILRDAFLEQFKDRRDPSGVLIKAFSVESDFLPKDNITVAPADPFDVTDSSASATWTQSTIPQSFTLGLNHQGRGFYDATEYLSSRGVAFSDKDWAAFDPERGALFVRLADQLNFELVQVLTESRHCYPVALLHHHFDVFAEATDDIPQRDSLYYYSIPTRSGLPCRLSISHSNNTENQSNVFIKCDPITDQFGYAIDTSFNLDLPLNRGRTKRFTASNGRFSFDKDHPAVLQTKLPDESNRPLLIEVKSDVTYVPEGFFE